MSDWGITVVELPGAPLVLPVELPAVPVPVPVAQVLFSTVVDDTEVQAALAAHAAAERPHPNAESGRDFAGWFDALTT